MHSSSKMKEWYCILHYCIWSQYIPCCLCWLEVQLDVSLKVWQWWPKTVIHRDKLLGFQEYQLSCQQEKMKHIVIKRHFCLLPQVYAAEGTAISFTSKDSVLQWQYKFQWMEHYAWQSDEVQDYYLSFQTSALEVTNGKL